MLPAHDHRVTISANRSTVEVSVLFLKHPLFYLIVGPKHKSKDLKKAAGLTHLEREQRLHGVARREGGRRRKNTAYLWLLPSVVTGFHTEP